MARLDRAIRSLVYFSVALGVVLLFQVYNILPTRVLLSILGGWIAYVVAAIAVARGRRSAYPAVFTLALLTLIVSLPQSAHYAFVESGMLLPAATFIIGSAVQVCLVILVLLRFISSRRKAA